MATTRDSATTPRRTLSRSTSRTHLQTRLSLFLHHPTSSCPNLPLLAPEWPAGPSVTPALFREAPSHPLTRPPTLKSDTACPTPPHVPHRRTSAKDTRTVQYISLAPEKELITVALEQVSSNDSSVGSVKSAGGGGGEGRRKTRKWWRRSGSSSSFDGGDEGGGS